MKMTLDELYTMRRDLREVDNIKENIAILETRRVAPKVAVYGRETVRGCAVTGNVQLDTLAQMDALIAKYNTKLSQILDTQERFERCIESLPACDRVILRKYFIFGMSWEQVCVDEGKSYRHIMRIWRAARDRLFERVK